ncbi:hypothetical protein ABTK92_19645, partial [Acinetobacter baumannii]
MSKSALNNVKILSTIICLAAILPATAWWAPFRSTVFFERHPIQKNIDTVPARVFSQTKKDS